MVKPGLLKMKNVLFKENKKGIPVKIGKYVFIKSELLLNRDTLSENLTLKEAALLEYFVHHKGRLVKKSDILESLWGKDDYFMGKSLDVFISRLRKYLKADPSIIIQNIRGVGFRFIFEG